MLFGLLKTKNEKAIEELQEQVMTPNYIEVKQDLSPLQSEEVITTDLELDKGKAYIVYYTMTEYKILYEIVAENTDLLSKMTIDFDESNVRFLING